MGILSGVNNFFFDVVKFFNKPGPTRTFDIALTRSRVKQNVKTAELLGVTDVTMHESSVLFALTGLANNVLTETLDTTTYSDKAILRLYNGTGHDRYITTLQLDGKRIMRYSGSGGGLVFDGLKKDDDIRRNGLQEMEISNNYLVTAVQVEKVGDYWWKAAGKKKHLFALTIPGVAWWYSPGDWYNFAVGTAGTAEYIDAVVECYSVDVEKTAGAIGSTNIMFREVEENWAKTTLYTARLLASGSPKRRVNRSNTVTVASATYSGTYDYRCDGVDDDVQIQAAIDYVYQTYGGGTIQLTYGSFNTSDRITMNSNIILKGIGNNTIIKPSATVDYGIYASSKTNLLIVDLAIDGGNLISELNIRAGIALSGSYSSSIAQNINVYDFKNLGSGGSGDVYGIRGAGKVINCITNNIIGVTNNIYAYGILGSSIIEYCTVDTITGSGTGKGYGICVAKLCHHNRVSNCSDAKYSDAYADSGTSNACDDTAAGGYNS